LKKPDPAGNPGAGSPTRWPSRIARISCAVLVVAFVAAQFRELHFTLDNLSNFRVHFAVSFLLCAAFLARAGDRRLALVSIAGLVIALMSVVPWYFQDAEAAPAPGTVATKILVSNVHVHNRQHARLLRLIDEEQPDVVGLVEVNSRWLRKLASLRATYSHYFESPDEEFVGLALYSRLPLSNARVLRVGKAGTPAIAATMSTPDGEIDFILAHPMSPLDAAHVKGRNEQLRALGSYVGTLRRPVVVAGDLNVTMWNRSYRQFAASGGLHNARAGHGVGPTWPAVPLLGVPIDHVVATAPVRFRNFEVHQGIGSDHLPVSAEFSLH
jgi:endonuclease/exonuclease/phosphatase (EEP) superfamily protein YafD